MSTNTRTPEIKNPEVKQIPLDRLTTPRYVEAHPGDDADMLKLLRSTLRLHLGQDADSLQSRWVYNLLMADPAAPFLNMPYVERGADAFSAHRLTQALTAMATLDQMNPFRRRRCFENAFYVGSSAGFVSEYAGRVQVVLGYYFSVDVLPHPTLHAWTYFPDLTEEGVHFDPTLTFGNHRPAQTDDGRDIDTGGDLGGRYYYIPVLYLSPGSEAFKRAMRSAFMDQYMIKVWKEMLDGSLQAGADFSPQFRKAEYPEGPLVEDLARSL